MSFDPMQTSLAEREAIAKRAGRSVASEASLIWGLGGSVLVVLIAMMGQSSMAWLAGKLSVSPTVALAASSFGASGAAAIVHHRVAGPKIEQAQRQNAAILYAYELEKQLEHKAKAARMNDDRGHKA